MSPRAVLIGPMAAGKTKVGKRAARLLALGFVDTDKVVVARHGAIAGIFADRGEAAFRAIERGVVEEVLRTDGIVSLGGGAVLDAGTRADLRDLPVVYLHARAEAVASRLAAEEGRRPLVAGGIADWERIFAERRPVYEELADLDLDTSTGEFDRIAETVAEWIRSRG